MAWRWLLPAGLTLLACQAVGPRTTAPPDLPPATFTPPVAPPFGPTPTEPNAQPVASSTAVPAAVAAAATVSEIQIVTEARDGADRDWAPAGDGQPLPLGGQVQTLDTGMARVDVRGGAIVRLGPNTLITMEALASSEAPATLLGLDFGELWLVLATATGSDLAVDTPVGVAVVRGTYLNVDFDQASDSLIVSCLEGTCGLRNAAGEVLLRAGEETHVLRRGLRPEPPRPLDPVRLARWQRFVPEALRFVQREGTRLAPTWLAPQFLATRPALQTALPRRHLSELPDLLATAQAAYTPPPLRATVRTAATFTVPPLIQTRRAANTPAP